MRMNGNMTEKSEKFWICHFGQNLDCVNTSIANCDQSSKSFLWVIIGQILFPHRLLNVIPKMYIQTLMLERKQKQRISRPRWKKKETDLLSWRFECDKCDVRSVAYEVEIKVCFRKSRNISNSSQINLHVNQWYSLTLKSNEPSNMEILKEGR